MDADVGLLVASVVDPIIDDGTGERDYVVVTLAELLPEYRLGVGDMTVDLSGVDIGAEQREVEIELAIGKLVVYLPAEPALDLTIDNDIGQIGFTDESGRSQQSFETTDNSGVGNDLRVVEESDVGTGRLKVTVKNRIGDVEVIRVGS